MAGPTIPEPQTLQVRIQGRQLPMILQAAAAVDRIQAAEACQAPASAVQGTNLDGQYIPALGPGSNKVPALAPGSVKMRGL